MYGLNGAPAIWQRYVDGLFQGMDGVKVFMDDARITGSDEISHFGSFRGIFKKCREHGLKLNLNKNVIEKHYRLLLRSYDRRRKDIELGPLLRALREGKDLQGREAQYTIEDGCIMYGQRVCIPRKFRKNVLEELHAGHLGIVKMKAIARSFVYWKNIDNDIEEAAKNCVDCARYKADPPKSKVHYWEYPSMPWERIHVDFAGPIFEHTFFLIVDAHSKWLEVYPMKVTTTKKTIECLRDSFARFGLPRVLVSDNGSQFTSYEFQRFMHKNGVRHKTSTPFKPSSNGQAERYVATSKQSLRAMHKYEGTIQQKLSTFLMQYRKVPNDKLRRDNFEFRDRKFDVGDRVAVRVYRAANTRWKFGTIWRTPLHH
ncbi:uncharacterized protein K02A2.6 [Trichonephila clavipes]|nr:uncharacterized protein K02A2.6 [Trichonephila clavipes]